MAVLAGLCHCCFWCGAGRSVAASMDDGFERSGRKNQKKKTPKARVELVMPTTKEMKAKETAKPTGLPAPPQWNLQRNTKVRLIEVDDRKLQFPQVEPPVESDQKLAGVVRNITDGRVAFKIKSDNKLVYTSVPNKGIIEPQGKADIVYVMKKNGAEKPAVAESGVKPAKSHFIVEAIEWAKGEPFTQETWTLMADTIGVDVHKIQLKIYVGSDEVSEHSSKKQPVGPEKINIVSTEQQKLTFKGPFGHKQTQRMNMTSLSDTTCAFKVQTNKPLFYQVKPAKGLLKPKSTIPLEFEVAENFTDADLSKVAQGAHKFQVQAVNWPEGDDPKFDAKVFEAEKKKALQSFHIAIAHTNNT